MALGKQYPIDFEKTRMRVLREATNLFSIRGFEGVSMNEIAQAVGIKAPSLYNHFEKKEDILDAIFITGIEWMEEYYRRFEEDDTQAESLEESMENIFLEVREVVDPFGMQVIMLSHRYAASNQYAYNLFYNAFYDAGLHSIRKCLERGQAKNFVPKTVSIEPFATLMMDFVAHNNVYWSFIGSSVYKLKRNRAWFNAMEQYFINILLAGV